MNERIRSIINFIINKKFFHINIPKYEGFQLAKISSYSHKNKIFLRENQNQSQYFSLDKRINIKKTHSRCEYYINLLHEIAHSTGEEYRLNRQSFVERNNEIEEAICEASAVYMLISCGEFSIEDITDQLELFTEQNSLNIIEIEMEYIINSVIEIIEFLKK